MNDIIQQVNEHLSHHDIATRVEGDAVVFNMTSDSGTWNVVVDCDGESQLVSMISLPPLRVPQAQRPAMAVQLVRLNAGQRMGAWHMDMDAGQLYHCVSVPVAGLAENIDSTMDAVVSLSIERVACLMEKAASHAYRWSDDGGGKSDHPGSPKIPIRIQFN